MITTAAIVVASLLVLQTPSKFSTAHTGGPWDTAADCVFNSKPPKKRITWPGGNGQTGFYGNDQGEPLVMVMRMTDQKSSISFHAPYPPTDEVLQIEGAIVQCSKGRSEGIVWTMYTSAKSEESAWRCVMQSEDKKVRQLVSDNLVAKNMTGKVRLGFDGNGPTGPTIISIGEIMMDPGFEVLPRPAFVSCPACREAIERCLNPGEISAPVPSTASSVSTIPVAVSAGSCATGYECNSGFCSSGKCTQPTGAGTACDTGFACLSGWCSNNKCAETTGLGSSCSTGYSCSSKWCNNGKCAAPLSTGSPCQAGESCVTGWCNNGKCGALSTDGSSCATGYSCQSKWCNNSKCTARHP